MSGQERFRLNASTEAMSLNTLISDLLPAWRPSILNQPI